MKLPPYGNAIATRLRFRNPPLHVVVCVGLDVWRRAKQWNGCPNDVCAVVLPDGNDPCLYAWPVLDQLVVIEAAIGPTDDYLRNLAAVLLAYGADTVTVTSLDGTNRFRQFVAAEKQENAA